MTRFYVPLFSFVLRRTSIIEWSYHHEVLYSFQNAWVDVWFQGGRTRCSPWFANWTSHRITYALVSIIPTSTTTCSTSCSFPTPRISLRYDMYLANSRTDIVYPLLTRISYRNPSNRIGWGAPNEERKGKMAANLYEGRCCGAINIGRYELVPAVDIKLDLQLVSEICLQLDHYLVWKCICSRSQNESTIDLYLYLQLVSTLDQQLVSNSPKPIVSW